MNNVSHESLEERLQKLETVAYWRVSSSARMRSLEGLQAFLVETALPLELRCVNDAFFAVENGGIGAISGIEAELSSADFPKGVASAQKSMERQALSRLAPLVDEGLIQKYRAEVSAGRMEGWGPIVFGLELRAFSIPLAQGLTHYGISVVEARRPCDSLFESTERRSLDFRAPLGSTFFGRHKLFREFFLTNGLRNRLS